MDLHSRHMKHWLTRSLTRGGHAASHVAHQLGVSQQTFARWLHPHYPNALPAHLLPRWTQHFGAGLIRYLCRRCGGRFQPGPTSPAPEPLQMALRHSRDVQADARRLLDAISRLEVSLSEAEAVYSADPNEERRVA